MKAALPFLAILAASPIRCAIAYEVRFADCPPAVQQAIRAEGGRIDEIDYLPSSDRYVAELHFGRTFEKTLEITSRGRVARKVEDVRLGKVPDRVRATVRRLAAPDGRVDDLERETEGRRIFYRVEVDYPQDRDRHYVMSRKGVVLRRHHAD